VLGRSTFTLRLGTRVLTARTIAAAGHLPSQGIYRVAPGGERLAWLDGGVLRVIDAAASERAFGQSVSMFRFAPDGGQLAFVDRDSVVLADVKSGERRVLGAVDAQYFLWMEWVRGGPIVVARSKAGPRTITWFPTSGVPRLVVTQPEHIERAVGTPASTTIVWLTGRGIFTADVTAGNARRLSDEPATELITAEMSPDGREVTWSYDAGMKRIDVASGRVSRVGRVHASSLWYGTDGALAYSWLDNAFVRRGDDVKKLLPRSNIEARVHGLRFRRDAPGLLVVEKDELLAWDPDAGKLERLARADGLVDADLFRGGVVTLVSTPDPADPPRQR
jgi:hypothetical protein